MCEKQELSGILRFAARVGESEQVQTNRPPSITNPRYHISYHMSIIL
jgi:hypothetical protein